MKKIKYILASLLAALSIGTATAGSTLAGNIQDGVILHCFDWSYVDITDELENIAAAGFTAVQTSPAQVGCGSGAWYWLYQPLGFYLSTNELGTASELEALCTKAHELGVFVIVDVVANHLAGDHTNIQSDLLDSQYWHSYGSSIDYSNRYAVTHGDIGMQDLATENSYVQSCVVSYLKELAEIGVDGIRWDAAKHISLPSETDGSQFWPAVTTSNGITTKLGNSLYNYGEILDGPSSNSSDYYLMTEYNDYISVTDNTYGNGIRSSLSGGAAPSGYGNWNATGYCANNKLVYWAESHDTYSNDSQESTWVDVNVIDRTWAIVASRNEITALYFSRPSATSNSSILAGVKGSTHFTSDEVAEVNHFHNVCIGEPDYFVSENNNVAICRASGAVIVLGSGTNTSVSITNGGGYTTAGTYTDHISGNTFTVTSSTISGTVGSTGIAVLYNDDTPKVTLTAGQSFKTETLDITATPNDATTSFTLQIGSGTATTYTTAQTITIGADMEYDETVTIYWTATNDTKTTSGSTTYTKKDPNATIGVYVQASSAPYLYVWNDDNTSINGTWPGTQMTETVEVCGTTYYYADFADYDEISIILNDGSGNDSGKTDDITDITADIYLYWNGTTGYSTLSVDPSDCEDGNSGSTSSTVNYYLAGSFNDWLEIDAENSSSNNSSTTTTDGITVYVSGSSSYYLYAWDDKNNKPLGEWPGTQFSALSTTTVDGTTYYYYTFTDVTSVNVVFNTGSGGSQTGDITGITSDVYYSYSGGTTATSTKSLSLKSSSTTTTVWCSGSSSYYMYAWDSSENSLIGTWPGTQFSALNTKTINGTTYYGYTFDVSPVNVIFNTGNGGNQTDDLENITGTVYYSYSGGTTASALDVSGINYDEDYKFTLQDDGTYTFSIDAATIGDDASFMVYADDGSIFGYGSSVAFGTEYTYPIDGDATTFASSTEGTLTFVITSVADQAIAVRIDDSSSSNNSSTSVTDIDASANAAPLKVYSISGAYYGTVDSLNDSRLNALPRGLYIVGNQRYLAR